MTGVALLIVVLSTFVVVVLTARGSSDDIAGNPIVLVPSNDTGAHPVTSSIAVVAMPLPAAASQSTPQLTVSAARGIGLAAGTQPGLYGGSPQANSCDAAALANILDAKPSLAAQWGNAIGVSPQVLPFYLNTLTPAVVLSDTWVTSHILVDEVMAPEQAILQSGNAVLVDPVGVPRVHCASGAPLLPPREANLAAFVPVGEGWQGFDTQRVIAIAYSDPSSPHEPVTEFTMQDLTASEMFTRPVGGTINLASESTVTLPDPSSMNIAPRLPAR
ncbi:hypothetical protein CYL16_12195 [Mycobacterium sp. EPG1]|nr:hypothetical protein CYL16_12195 [Mycobacterium sp. EPG1]